MAKTINFSNGTQAVYMDNADLEKVAFQIVTDGSFDGTTTTAKLQESCDDSNWHDVEDSSGNAVEITVGAASTSYMLKSSIVFGQYVRCLVTVGDATTGSADVHNNYKA